MAEASTEFANPVMGTTLPAPAYFVSAQYNKILIIIIVMFNTVNEFLNTIDTLIQKHNSHKVISGIIKDFDKCLTSKIAILRFCLSIMEKGEFKFLSIHFHFH